MMHEFFIWLLLTLPVATTGFVYAYILTRPGQIFGKLYALAVDNLPEWIHQPLISCEKCTTGQLAFWLYPLYITDISFRFIVPIGYVWAIVPVHITNKFAIVYDFISHIGFVAISIYVVGFVKEIYLRFVEKGTPAPSPMKKKLKPPPEVEEIYQRSVRHQENKKV